MVKTTEDLLRSGGMRTELLDRLQNWLDATGATCEIFESAMPGEKYLVRFRTPTTLQDAGGQTIEEALRHALVAYAD